MRCLELLKGAESAITCTAYDGVKGCAEWTFHAQSRAVSSLKAITDRRKPEYSAIFAQMRVYAPLEDHAKDVFAETAQGLESRAPGLERRLKRREGETVLCSITQGVSRENQN
jgi:hypothetical protein